MKLNVNLQTTKKKTNKVWQFSVGSGHAALALRTDFCRQLKKVHDELGIKYVRFHGIFNDDMSVLSDFDNVLAVPGGSKFQEYSFHRCGLVYDNVLDCGMKPFVEISFMPELLAADSAHGKGFYGSIMSPPKDLCKWADFIKEFIKYLLKRYGEDEVASWYLEVWNEPDLKGMFFKGTQEDYFKLYNVTANAIKEICPQLRVGGPATSGSKWVSSFREYCQTNNVPLDFISTHQYTGEPFIGIEDTGGPNEEIKSPVVDDSEDLDKVMDRMQMLSQMFENLPEETSLLEVLRTFSGDPTETNEMDRDILLKNAAVVKKQANGLPVFYTEWNLSASFSAYSNDTRKTAAYDLRTALKSDSLVTGSSIWCFSDIFEELHQFTEEFHGGFGMLTLNGIPKPVYHAMKMLAETETYQLELAEDMVGEIEVAAFTGDKEDQILLYRQCMKQEDKPIQQVEVSVQAVQKPKAVILQRIDELHCNPLKMWEEAGRPNDMTKSEVREMIDRTAMQEEIMEYQYQDGMLTFQVGLGVNDIYFIRMKR